MSSARQVVQAVAQGLQSADPYSAASPLRLSARVIRERASVAHEGKQGSAFERVCASALQQPWASTVAGYLGVLACGIDNRWHDAYTQASEVLTWFLGEFDGVGGRAGVPFLLRLAALLRISAIAADRQVGDGAGTREEEAARLLSRCFQATNADRTTGADSKKWGALGAVNESFRVYFALNNLRLCKNLIRAVGLPSFPDLGEFPKSQSVTYRFYAGRLAMMEADYDTAGQHLGVAFAQCNIDSTRNMRAILTYLVPVKLVLGVLPTQRLLQRFELTQFQALVAALRVGNLRQFEDALTQHQEYFIRLGVFLLLEKLRTLAYRNLFKRVHRIAGDTRIDVSLFAASLDVLGVGMPEDEVECILANLIANGHMRGYISHEKKKVVLSAKSAFPPFRALAG